VCDFGVDACANLVQMSPMWYCYDSVKDTRSRDNRGAYAILLWMLADGTIAVYVRIP
jgi:hypothetical protein